MKTFVASLLIVIGFAGLRAAQPGNLVTNGSFELTEDRSERPRAWAAAGNRAIQQRLTLDAGRDGRRCARLDCTAFHGDGPDYHAMLCQVGKVHVRRGHWYRLTFRAKARDLKAGAVEVALVNMRPWNNAGLSDAFTPGAEWRQYTKLFRANQDLPAADSRLQFWFKTTGTLWLDDVVLTESDEGQQWFPQIATEGVKNFIPNSSFECGPANWGSWTWGLQGWAGNLYRLEGQVDNSVAHHGAHSLRITLTPDTLPVFWFDYYEPVRQPVRRVLAANRGWFHVPPGQALTLSAWLRADADGVPAQLAVNEAPNRRRNRLVTVDKTWRRYTFTFTPTQPFLFIAVGLDLEGATRNAATLWVDAVQLERGNQATAYTPRQPVESLITTEAPGNVFTGVEQGARLEVRAFNDTGRGQIVSGGLKMTDFFEQPLPDVTVKLRVGPHADTITVLTNVTRGRRGFFRAAWATPACSNALRLAVIQPLPVTATDSPFGFNHAYPWDFLVTLARQAGIVWWRDWSAKWQTVEPARGQWDFTVPDQQIERVLGLNSQVEVLLPFPSARWSSTAKAEEVAKAAGNNSYLRARLPVAYAPKDLADFGRYAARVVKHYRQSRPRPVTHYQILNEPIYTSYALPRQFGYTLDDYLRLLRVAWQSMKAADPDCRVVGGISASLEAGLVRDFVRQGGLRFVDVVDLHLYQPARPAETYEESFASFEALMRAHGGPRPVWITEWGCYADDDPPCEPYTVGDSAMNRCRWPSERAATEHIVQFAATGFAHGLRKLFFHAGTCGPINGPDAGGVLFEYGGAPRKMYAGIAALTELLGVPDACVKRIRQGGRRVYVFRTRGRAVAVAWDRSNQLRRLTLPAGVRAFDIMGNRLKNRALTLKNSPVYLIAAESGLIVNLFLPL